VRGASSAGVALSLSIIASVLSLGAARRARMSNVNTAEDLGECNRHAQGAQIG